MIARSVFWRSFVKDKIFVFLFGLTVLSFLAALAWRRPTIESNPVPFILGLSFLGVNILFALLSLKREPLLAYMFLTASILMNGSLYFFFRYLFTIQGGEL